jgi:hypothetical protein
MSDRKKARRIEIPEDVAAAAGMPDDLDASALDPYAVPDPARRRRAGVVYLVAAIVTGSTIAAGLPSGMWLMVIAFVLIGAYHFLAGWHLAVREGRALEAANRAIGFPVGHASAALGFTGWRSRPVWNVLVFSADDPPTRRGLVRVDAIDGTVVEHYDEAVPADEL